MHLMVSSPAWHLSCMWNAAPVACIFGPAQKIRLANSQTDKSCKPTVVHVQRCNGAKVPVTIQLSQYDDGEKAAHIVKVLPSSEEHRLDQQRLVLTVGESGTIIGTNAGATRALFGFDPKVCCQPGF